MGRRPRWKQSNEMEEARVRSLVAPFRSSYIVVIAQLATTRLVESKSYLDNDVLVTRQIKSPI